MKRDRIFVTGLVLVLVGSIVGVLAAALAPVVHGNLGQCLAQDLRTWYVDDDKLDCPTADFTRIQDAMDASSYGDTLVVCPGNYHEIDPVIEPGREVIIEEAAVWRVGSLLIGEGTHLIIKGTVYLQAGGRISMEPGARMSLEPGARVSVDRVPFLIVDQAMTDKDVYLALEPVQLVGLVLDQSGTAVSANVTAEIERPDGTVETVSLDETETGTYEGTFNDTSADGVYRVAIEAEKPEYTGHTVWLAFEVGKSATVCTETATGTGEVCFTTSHGFIEDLQALPVPANPPDGYTFPDGLFSFRITGLASGQTVTVTIELPSPVPAGTKWWKYHDGQWYDYNIPITMSGNTITITLTDGGVGDIDDVAGQITDPGGPGYPLSLGYTVGWETQPINKAAVMAPWIGLLAAIAGASLLVLRRRQTQS